MPFDTQTRNRLARLVTVARELITAEFAQQLQSVYGIAASGEVTPLSELGHLDEEQRALAELLRDRVEYLQASSVDEKDPAVAAVDRLTREQAFTILNRLAALRMAENRGFILESVGRGYQSKGFQVYSQVAGSGLGDTYHRYRRYLFCLFDEIAVDLGALFDRRLPAGLLFPRETTLLALFQLINGPEIDPLWAEDETIGWIYQYYNDEAERKRMREQSAAPRNSRELAVRNQFFTPRYVVEFLVDNTLGRIWYEACKGETALRELCRYLVRGASEVFLAEGEATPIGASTSENLNNEDLLSQPVHISHRPRKDPRDLKILDPACGSGHFLLYSFDLLETIYEEALLDDQQVPSEVTGRTIREDYRDLPALREAVPELIIRHNLHGIDIDLRACQMAALALWLRAQRTYQRHNLKPSERPTVTKSNIVCAEPMPGDRALLGDFVADLQPKILGQLVQVVFEKMKSAGEAGVLLKIDDEIASAVAEAKRLWLAGPKAEQTRLFAEDARPEQMRLGFDLSGITDKAFWDKAEERIYTALEAYAEHAENGSTYERRSFVSDAVRGFSFIDICRKRYEVVLMNPPFGTPPETVVSELDRYLPSGSTELAAAFIVRGLQMCSGKLGAIVTRSLFMMPGAAEWRSHIVALERFPAVLADFGGGVLDAFVETSACIFAESVPKHSLFFDMREVNDKAASLDASTIGIHKGVAENVFVRSSKDFEVIPLVPFCYWVDDEMLRIFGRYPAFEPTSGAARTGLATLDNFRFLRCWWELPSRDAKHSWKPLAKGGETWPFFGDIDQRVLWRDEGKELKCFVADKVGSVSRKIQATEYYGLPGITWIQRSQLGFCPRPLPVDCIFDTKGPSAFPHERKSLLSTLGLFSTALYQEILDLQVSAFSYHPGVVQRSPFPVLDEALKDRMSVLTRSAYGLSARLRLEESMVSFVRPSLISSPPDKSLAAALSEVGSVNTSALEELLVCADELEVAAHQAYEICESSSIPGRRSRTRNRMLRLERTANSSIEDLISWMVGCSFGRWDVRVATDRNLPYELPDPFAPLPVCPPGMLLDESQLPLEEADLTRLVASGKWEYPLNLPWEGILVDDAENANDIVSRIREAFNVIWKERAETVEFDACGLLKVENLREYLRKPSLFFADHLKHYSKSRRQAPIYWPLSTPSGRYTLWLYYPRLTAQTLHQCMADFLMPKLKNVSAEIQMLRGSNGSQSRLGELVELQDELKDMQVEIERIIKLPYVPNPDDGVLVTASPLWKLFRLPKWQKDLKGCWEEVQAGDYDWAHIAFSIFPDRVKQKCKGDRSLAIAHNLEHLCALDQPKPKAKKGRAKQAFLVSEDAT
jgi:hypothetical protein